MMILHYLWFGQALDAAGLIMIDTGSVAWVLASTALVLLMTPALGLFYGGMVRKKNFLSVLMLVFASLMLVILQWFLVGYSLAFGTTHLGIIGGLEHLGLAGVGFEALRGLEIPDLLFAAFQMTFAGLTLAIIVSGVAERIRFEAFLIFGILWTTFVYDPLAHWLWGRRLAGTAWCSGLCGRNGRPYQCRVRRSGSCNLYREAVGFWCAQLKSAEYSDDLFCRWSAAVRLDGI